MGAVTISIDLEGAKKVLATYTAEVSALEARLAQKRAARDEIAKQIAQAESGNKPGSVGGSAAEVIDRLLHDNITRRFTQSEIVQETGIPQPTVARALKKMKASATVIKEGNLYSHSPI